ncbi:MAG: hypothetical protein ACR2QE_05780 [Acidimicrobiales bacterium]
MTVTEPSTVPLLNAEARSADQPVDPAAVSVSDTTEVRWFFPGSIPPEVLSWFVGSGMVQERYDTYLLEGRDDIGVKRRFGHTLELKVRRLRGGLIELDGGLAGSLEVWRKWSPAEGLVELGEKGIWVDVHKVVVKRRFSETGSEVAFSPDVPATGTGCDVEVASVSVGDRQGWTLAFASFGPPSVRQDALRAAWRTVVATAACPVPLEPSAGQAMGYPEWLARSASPAAGGDDSPNNFI